MCHRWLEILELANWGQLDADREGFWAGFVGVCAAGSPAIEASLEQAHQACVPIADYKQHEKRRGEEVAVGEGIDDGQREVGTDG